ncbi:MAG: hypothetical protein DWQ37_10290 [Planctomycetota bacterium]|nr:MAG: hypothetical protein DWQ37_10290 [Planctomycetota bacterium]
MSIENILERASVSGRVDRQAGVIRGVKILGLDSKNGRTYTEEACQKAASLYEGAKVNVNHPKGRPDGPRDYQDRIGTLHNVRFERGGLFGDLHFNVKHPLAEQLMWDAEHSPQSCGLSHNAECRISRRSGKQVVEAIVRVRSVDLVAEPATASSLFESVGDDPETVHSTEQFVATLRGQTTIPASVRVQATEAMLGRSTVTFQNVHDFVHELRRD